MIEKEELATKTWVMNDWTEELVIKFYYEEGELKGQLALLTNYLNLKKIILV